MADITKSEEQIAKDKEAVKAMTGAKAAMEAALRRIDTLEQSIKMLDRQITAVAAAYGENVHLNVWSYSQNSKQIVKASDFFDGIRNSIKAVL